MRLLATLSIIFCVAFSFEAPNAEAAPGLRSVCRTSEKLRHFLVKADISDHIGNADPRAAGYTMVCGRECPSLPAGLYYSNGKLAARFGYYGTWNVTGRPRAYGNCCGVGRMVVREIVARARRLRNKNLYIVMNARKKTCRHFDSRSRRVGSPF